MCVCVCVYFSSRYPFQLTQRLITQALFRHAENRIDRREFGMIEQRQSSDAEHRVEGVRHVLGTIRKATCFRVLARVDETLHLLLKELLCYLNVNGDSFDNIQASPLPTKPQL